MLDLPNCEIYKLTVIVIENASRAGNSEKLAARDCSVARD